MITHLLYLHGFRSSPQSYKARWFAEQLARHHGPASGRPIHFLAPQLPPSPAAAIELIQSLTAGWPAGQMAIVGSSLGGYYTSHWAERLGCRAVVLNPAIDPARDLAAYIGENKAWHSEDRFYFLPEYVDELQAIRPPALSQPDRYFAVISKQDELLDWREMMGRYGECPHLLLETSDHGLTDFELHWPAVARFLGLDWR